MTANNHTNNDSTFCQKDLHQAEVIFHKLNQGSLHEIYQIMEKLEGENEEVILEQAFFERYHFDFKEYI